MKILIDGKPAELVQENPTVRKIGDVLAGLKPGELLSTDGIIKRMGRSESMVRTALRGLRVDHGVRFGKIIAWGSKETVAAVRKEKGSN